MTKPVNQGGLGLQPPNLKNRALLGKWAFKWFKDRGKGWNKWLSSKYNYQERRGFDISFNDSKISSF